MCACLFTYPTYLHMCARTHARMYVCMYARIYVQGGSNMTGTDVARFTHKQSRSYLNHLVYEKVKQFLYSSITGPNGSRRLRLPVVRLSALRTGRLYPPGNMPGKHFCYKLGRPQGHSVPSQ